MHNMQLLRHRWMRKVSDYECLCIDWMTKLVRCQASLYNHGVGLPTRVKMSLLRKAKQMSLK